MTFRQNSCEKKNHKFTLCNDQAWPHLLRIIVIITIAYILLPPIN